MLNKISFKIIPEFLLIMFILFFGTSACNLLDSNDDEKKDDLYVQFNNDSISLYTITSIELLAIGRADETPDLSGTWTSNMLEGIGEIPPGGQQYFHADIPNLHRCYYRLGVKTVGGATMMLQDQTHYVSDVYPTLTHWGSDERTVTVTIIEDTDNNLVYINGWSEWAGIE